jgi:hypothetical protein
MSPTPELGSEWGAGGNAATRHKALATISTFVLNPVLELDPACKEWKNSNARWASPKLVGPVIRSFIITDINHSTQRTSGRRPERLMR